MNWIADYIDGHGEEFWQRALKIHGYAELAGRSAIGGGALQPCWNRPDLRWNRAWEAKPTAFRRFTETAARCWFLCEYDACPS